jgi:hypothetical protein
LIARTNTYTTVNGVALTSQADPKLTGAVSQALLNPPANSTIGLSTYCPSGNCTFAHTDGVAYSTLEICSIVQDASKSVDGTASKPGRNATWVYRLPSGLNITYDGPYDLNNSNVVLASWVRDVDVYGSSTSSAVLTLEVLMMTTDCVNPFDESSAHQCSIYPLAVDIVVAPCVVQYGNVSISGSIFRETARSSVMLDAPEGLDYVSVGISSSFPGVDCSGSKIIDGKKTTKTVWYTNGSTPYRCPEPAVCKGYDNDVLWYDPACISHFGYASGFGLARVLEQVFNLNYGRVSGGSGGPDILMLADWGSLDQPLTLQDQSQLWLAPLWASGHANISSVSKVMRSLTGTVNAAIRSSGNTDTPARGDVLGN